MTEAIEVKDTNTKLQRLENIKSNPQTMNEVAQRVAEGETLKEISAAWEISFGLFQLWIMSDRERADLYNGALCARADEMVHEAVKNADDVYCRDDSGEIMKNKDGVPIFNETSRSRLQAKTRLSVATMLDRKRFGSQAGREVKAPVSGHAGVGEVVKILAQAFAEMDAKKNGKVIEGETIKEETI